MGEPSALGRAGGADSASLFRGAMCGLLKAERVCVLHEGGKESLKFTANRFDFAIMVVLLQ